MGLLQLKNILELGICRRASNTAHKFHQGGLCSYDKEILQLNTFLQTWL